MFEFDKIEDFKDHISKSIPGYNILNNIILSLCEYYKVEDHPIYDLGCSDGKLLIDIDHPFQYKIGVDNSYKLLHSTFTDSDNFFKQYCDLKDFEFNDIPCIVLSIFTMQFLSIELRKKLIKETYRNLLHGGCFIIAEKVYEENGKIQELSTMSFYDFKKQSFSAEEILEKEKQLRVHLRPLTSEENINILKEVGFKQVHKFFKILNFEAYLCIK
jgi:tRNA (cmo5U34)-methyltransferase